MAFKTQWEIQLISNLIWIGRKAFFEHQKTNIEASKVVGVMNRRNEHQRQLSSKTEGGLKIVYYCIEQFHLEYRLGKMSFYSLQHCTAANKYKNEWWLRKWNRAHSSLKLLYNTGCLKSHYANAWLENLVSYSKTCMIERNWKDEWFAWWTTRATRKLIRLSDSYDWLRKISKSRYYPTLVKKCGKFKLLK